MQAVGSAVVNRAADTDLPDAASGFRAYSAASLMRLNIVTEFSYCMETIIQAGHKRLAIESVPVVTNDKTRESRLFTSIWQHMAKSASAIIRWRGSDSTHSASSSTPSPRAARACSSTRRSGATSRATRSAT